MQPRQLADGGGGATGGAAGFRLGARNFGSARSSWGKTGGCPMGGGGLRCGMTLLPADPGRSPVVVARRGVGGGGTLGAGAGGALPAAGGEAASTATVVLPPRRGGGVLRCFL